MKTLRTCINSIFAGAMIAIGSAIYLNCPNRIVGAFLFSIGLIVIMEFGFDLYTGRAGYTRTIQDVAYLTLTLITNAIGCMFVVLLTTPETAHSIWVSKLEAPFYIAFAKAVVCGILIYVCVNQNKYRTKEVSIMTTLVAIPAFILCGAEHSIANICFMFASKSISWEGVWFILIVAIGNAAGSLTLSIWTQKRNALYQNNKNRHS